MALYVPLKNNNTIFKKSNRLYKASNDRYQNRYHRRNHYGGLSQKDHCYNSNKWYGDKPRKPYNIDRKVSFSNIITGKKYSPRDPPFAINETPITMQNRFQAFSSDIDDNDSNINDDIFCYANHVKKSGYSAMQFLFHPRS